MFLLIFIPPQILCWVVLLDKVSNALTDISVGVSTIALYHVHAGLLLASLVMNKFCI